MEPEDSIRIDKQLIICNVNPNVEAIKKIIEELKQIPESCDMGVRLGDLAG
ncbi:MAG: hypothetical protein ACTSWA_05255 [Candidatus Thorarchaeota archaeon]